MQNAIIKAIAYHDYEMEESNERTRKITSIILAALMVLSALVVSAGGVSAATSSGSEVYFDNSKYGWKDVYVYAYGTKEMPNGRESL